MNIIRTPGSGHLKDIFAYAKTLFSYATVCVKSENSKTLIYFDFVLSHKNKGCFMYHVVCVRSFLVVQSTRRTFKSREKIKRH